MECVADGGKNGDIIIRDPYLFPLAHAVRTAMLFATSALGILFASSFFCPAIRSGPWNLTKKICCWYLGLNSFGCALEAAATVFLSESEPWMQSGKLRLQ